jgi:hypothetical protein
MRPDQAAAPIRGDVRLGQHPRPGSMTNPPFVIHQAVLNEYLLPGHVHGDHAVTVRVASDGGFSQRPARQAMVGIPRAQARRQVGSSRLARRAIATKNHPGARSDQDRRHNSRPTRPHGSCPTLKHF